MSSQRDNNMSMEPPMCANGCGFYGSVENKNMCSKCYRDHVKKQGNNITTTTVTTTKPVSIFPWANDLGASTDLASGISLPSSQTPDNLGSDDNQKSNGGCAKNRCEICNKKVGLLGFPCRCDGVFCGMHRHPEVHSCGVDRKKAGKEILAKQNPLIKGDKLECRI